MLREFTAKASEKYDHFLQEYGGFLAIAAIAAGAWASQTAIEKTGIDPHAGYGSTGTAAVTPANPEFTPK